MDVDLDTVIVALRARNDGPLDRVADGLEAGGEITATVLAEDMDGEVRVGVRLAVPPEVMLPLGIEDYEPLWDVFRGIVGYHDHTLIQVRVVIKPRSERWPPEGQRRRLVGRRVGGRYAIEDEVLGSGGSAVVRLAHDEQDDVFVAVKLLTEETASLRTGQRQRFLREMRLLRQLDHPHVLSALNFGEEDDGLLWVAMPRADHSLKDVIGRFAGDPAEISQLFCAICDGVEAMHNSNVLHRDLKPSNVLFVEGVWKVSDLGIAADVTSGSTTITQTDERMGTTHYAPPERDRPHDATHTWDVYSLGVVLADLWTGVEAKDRASNVIEGPFRTSVAVATRADASFRFQDVAALRDQVLRAARLAVEGDESVDDRRTRIEAGLVDDSAKTTIIAELIDSLVASAGEQRLQWLDLTARLSADQIGVIAAESPHSLVLLTDALGDVPSSTPFSQIDQICAVLASVASIAADGTVAANALILGIETAYEWDRWNAQGIIQRVIDELLGSRRTVVEDSFSRVDRSAVKWVLGDAIDSLPPGLLPDS